MLFRHKNTGIVGKVARGLVIDVHSHILPESVVNLIRKEGSKYGASVQMRGSAEWVVHEQGYTYPLFRKFYDAEEKLLDMNDMGIDFSILSPAPPMFMYWINDELSTTFARLVNEGTSRFVSANQQRFRGLATVPLQNPTAAVEVLHEAAQLTGLCGVEIGTTVEGKTLDDESYDTFFTACETLDWPVFLHPYYVGDKTGLSKYYLTNLIGNPLDTAVGAASLIFGGVLDRHPKLRVLLAHGGGYFPYQIGRLDHGYTVREESKTIPQNPSSYLRRFYYDEITFNSKALSFLIQQVGADRVVIGTDYPFDMAESQPLDLLNQVPELELSSLKRIKELNPLQLFRF